MRRPEKRNALSIELRVELADALDAAAGDARAIVLTGEGSAFCSGMDTTQFGGDRDHKQRLYDTSVRLFDTVARCPVPLFAAVNGPAIAGGFALALLCDVRVAASAASFGFPELGRHIPPSYAAAVAALPPALARELCLTGRVLDAAEALRLGVVAEVVEPAALLERTRAAAAPSASAAPHAIAAVKRRILLNGEATWLALLEQEQRELHDALLGEG